MGAAQSWHQFGIIDEPAMGNAFAGERTQVEQSLPRRDLTLDHPVERAAIEQFFRAFRRLPRDMHQFELLALFLEVREAALLPLGKIVECLHADAELDEMQRHEIQAALFFSISNRTTVAPSVT